MGRIPVASEPGSQIFAELSRADSELVIDEPGESTFYAMGLDEDLQRPRCAGNEPRSALSSAGQGEKISSCHRSTPQLI
jgi:hypothetical protein